MTNDINVGDVVAWEAVPSGALVLCYMGCVWRRGDVWRLVATNHHRSLVGWEDWDACSGDEHAPLWCDDDKDVRCTIIALGLTGQETADDLRRLAEVFEVREALAEMTAEDAARLLREAGAK